MMHRVLLLWTSQTRVLLLWTSQTRVLLLWTSQTRVLLLWTSQTRVLLLWTSQTRVLLLWTSQTRVLLHVDLTDQSPPAVDLTDQSPPAVDLTDQSPPAVDLTDQSPPAVDHTDQSPPAVDLTDQSPPAVDLTDQTAPAVDLTDQGSGYEWVHSLSPASSGATHGPIRGGGAQRWDVASAAVVSGLECYRLTIETTEHSVIGHWDPGICAFGASAEPRCAESGSGWTLRRCVSTFTHRAQQEPEAKCRDSSEAAPAETEHPIRGSLKPLEKHFPEEAAAVERVSPGGEGHPGGREPLSLDEA
uniref:Uncharacterized protein n=1 Tax=Knipowitschia caucasica TaxID=637954 RepID=A0AAV2K4U6_KNICA